MADANEGVGGRPGVGDAVPPPVNTDPGRARREGERPVGGRGEEERGGGPDPVNFFCTSVREKMAWDRDDCAFISVSLVRRMAVPLRIRLQRKKRKKLRRGE
jgi:hypothetical protein